MANEDLKQGMEDVIADSVPQRETATEAAARIRAERERGERHRVLGGFTKKLEVFGSLPGWHMAILNDVDNRLQEALAHGYDFVDRGEIDSTNVNVVSYNTDPGSRVRFVVGQKSSGEPSYAYLMKIPDEIHADDMLARETVNRRVDDGIRAGKMHAPGDTAEQGTVYTPKQVGINYDPGSAKTYVSRQE